MKLRKVVFPVAGHGSQFLPATKATPKEMLTVVDKPLIKYAVEEALEAGFTDLIFITGKTKRTIRFGYKKKGFESRFRLAFVFKRTHRVHYPRLWAL